MATRDEQVLLGLLGGGPASSSAELATRTGLGLRAVQRSLHALELRGHVERLGRSDVTLSVRGRQLALGLPAPPSLPGLGPEEVPGPASPDPDPPAGPDVRPAEPDPEPAAPPTSQAAGWLSQTGMSRHQPAPGSASARHVTLAWWVWAIAAVVGGGCVLVAYLGSRPRADADQPPAEEAPQPLAYQPSWPGLSPLW